MKLFLTIAIILHCFFSYSQGWISSNDAEGIDGTFNGLPVIAAPDFTGVSSFDIKKVLNPNDVTGLSAAFPIGIDCPCIVSVTAYLSGNAYNPTDPMEIFYGRHISNIGGPTSSPGIFDPVLIQYFPDSNDFRITFTDTLTTSQASRGDLYKFVFIRNGPGQYDDNFGDLYFHGAWYESKPLVVGIPERPKTKPVKGKAIKATNLLGQDIPIKSKGPKIIWYEEGFRKVVELD